MKKRILSVFLVLTMCLTLMPMAVFAEGTTYAITNGSPEVDNDTNYGYITVDETTDEGETVTVEVHPVDGYQLKTLTAVPEAPTISTIADVLATVKGFPKDVIEGSSPTIPSDAWTNGTGVKAFTYKNSALVLKSSSYMSAQLTTGVTFDATNNCYTTSVSTLGTLKFNMTDGVLTSFDYTGNTKHDYDGTYKPASTPSPSLKPITPAKQTDGTYQFEMPAADVTVTAEFEEVPVTIADVLPEGFPKNVNDNYWCKLENDNVYIYKTDSNLVFNDSTEDCYSVLLSSPLTKQENPKVSYVYSKDGTEIQFNMTGDNNDELDSIIVSDCTNTSCIGTYAAPKAFSVTYNANGATSGSAPANQTKTASVDLTLATNTGSLAKAGYTFAGWNTKADGSGTHYDTGATYTTDAALTLYAEWIEAPATKTIADILPENFPTTAENGWVNENDAKMYSDVNQGLVFKVDSTSTHEPLTSTVAKSENNYVFNSENLNLIFVMSDGVLEKVIASGLS